MLIKVRRKDIYKSPFNGNIKLRRVYIIFIFITLINLLIFFYKDLFAYVPYASYQDLYIEKTSSLEPWLQESSEFTKINYAEGSTLLSSVVKNNINNSDSIAIQIANNLFNLFHNRLGRPSQLISDATALDQFKLLNKYENEKLWCGNFASMFAFFCWSKRIPCRVIEVVNDTGHHVINEYYSNNHRKWILLDAMNSLIQSREKQHDLYNLIDVLEGVRKNRNIDFIGKENMYSKWYNQYYNPDNMYFYYKSLNKLEIYSLKEKVKRYILPSSWYLLYTEKENGNLLYFLKVVILLGWILVFFYLCGGQFK